jgi:hypothetical protein
MLAKPEVKVSREVGRDIYNKNPRPSGPPFPRTGRFNRHVVVVVEERMRAVRSGVKHDPVGM